MTAGASNSTAQPKSSTQSKLNTSGISQSSNKSAPNSKLAPKKLVKEASISVSKVALKEKLTADPTDPIDVAMVARKVGKFDNITEAEARKKNIVFPKGFKLVNKDKKTEIEFQLPESSAGAAAKKGETKETPSII